MTAAAPGHAARRKSEQRQRTVMVSIRFLPEEIEAVERRAAATGSLVSAYLRDLALTAAAAAQPAPGDERSRYERAALIDAVAKIRDACRRPEDVAGKTSGSGIVNGKYLAEHLLRIIGALPHICADELAPAAPAAAPEQPETLSDALTVRFPADMIRAVKQLATAEGMTVSAWIRRGVEREATRREAAAAPELAAQAALARVLGLNVPDELRRFL